MKVFKCDCGNVLTLKNKQPYITCKKCKMKFKITWSTDKQTKKTTFVARQAIK